MQGMWVCSWIGTIPWRREHYPLQYSCLENPHGHRSLASYSPWGCKESDMTEQLSLTFRAVWSSQKNWEGKAEKLKDKPLIRECLNEVASAKPKRKRPTRTCRLCHLVTGNLAKAVPTEQCAQKWIPVSWGVNRRWRRKNSNKYFSSVYSKPGLC